MKYYQYYFFSKPQSNFSEFVLVQVFEAEDVSISRRVLNVFFSSRAFIFRGHCRGCSNLQFTFTFAKHEVKKFWLDVKRKCQSRDKKMSS